MTPATTTPSTSNASSQHPVANNVPRRVSFVRLPDSRTSSKTVSRTSPETPERHRKKKSMSDLDKEEEAQMAKLYEHKTKKGVIGVMYWLQDKVKIGEAKEV